MLSDADAVHRQAREELLNQGVQDSGFTPDDAAIQRLKALGYLQ